ncbi:MAG: hypothetical protein ACRCVN_01945 [Spirochaetia bacterium]
MSNSFTHTLNKNEAAALYCLLRNQPQLYRDLAVFYTQLERFIFEELTIEEMENLDSLVERSLL